MVLELLRQALEAGPILQIIVRCLTTCTVVEDVPQLPQILVPHFLTSVTAWWYPWSEAPGFGNISRNVELTFVHYWYASTFYQSNHFLTGNFPLWLKKYVVIKVSKTANIGFMLISLVTVFSISLQIARQISWWDICNSIIFFLITNTVFKIGL